MGIGRRVDDKKGKTLSELPQETNSNSKSKKNRRKRQKKSSPVQKLFDTCKEVFASGGPGIVPSTEDIEKLRSVLDAITPEDVSLKPDMPFFRTDTTQRLPRITYLHIFECPNFSMGIFCLPPSGVIPLHNHPGMTVFGKLLFGTVHVKSYDWVADLPPQTPTSPEPTEFQSAELRLAKVKVDADFTAPCSPSVLYPNDGGNMHCFTAVTACAVLDVLGPPYSDPDGRPCTYYLNHPFSNFSVDGICLAEEEKKNHEWLQEREKPEDFEMVGTMYGGPRFEG